MKKDIYRLSATCFRYAVSAFVLMISLLHVQPAEASVPVGGEDLNYSLYLNWKFVWMKAGTARLHTVPTSYNGNDCIETTLYASTGKAGDAIFKLRDTLTAVMTPQLKPQFYHKHCVEGDGKVNEKVWYEYPSEGKVRVSQRKVYNSGGIKTTDTICVHPVYDMVSVIMNAREYDLNGFVKGQRVTLYMAQGARIDRQELVFGGTENVKTQSGQTRCYRFSIMEKETDSKGRVKESELIRFYIKDDAARTPVEIDFFMKIGMAKARLD